MEFYHWRSSLSTSVHLKWHNVNRTQERVGTQCLLKSSLHLFSGYDIYSFSCLYLHPSMLVRYLCFICRSQNFVCVQYEISAAADTAARVYKEETAEDEQSLDGICEAMRIGSKEKTSRLMQKMGKLVAVANPSLGNEWLQEVCSM